MDENVALPMRTSSRKALQSLLLWGVILGIVAVDAVWIWIDGWTIDRRGALVVLVLTLTLLLPLTIRRYRDEIRITATILAAAQLLSFMAAASALSYLIVATNAPLVDAQLESCDLALGFDWLAAEAWMQQHPTTRIALKMAYASGLLQLAVVILCLGLGARVDRLRAFMMMFLLATVVCVLFSGPWPAAGAWKHYGVGTQAQLETISHFELLRSGAMKHIPLGDMQGLISIPSLHTAMAVLLTYSMRGIRFVFPALLALNAAMLISTPIEGSHYLVDVLAGMVLAGLIIGAERWRSRVVESARLSDI